MTDAGIFISLHHPHLSSDSMDKTLTMLGAILFLPMGLNLKTHVFDSGL